VPEKGNDRFAHADLSRMVAIELATGRVLWWTPSLPGNWSNWIDFTSDGSTALAFRGASGRKLSTLPSFPTFAFRPDGKVLAGTGAPPGTDLAPPLAASHSARSGGHHAAR
jgi:hypothetical protein